MMIQTLALVVVILGTAAAQTNSQPFDMLLLVRQVRPIAFRKLLVSQPWSCDVMSYPADAKLCTAP